MNTPLCDFVESYREKGASRFHMPGHKGVGFLGCEAMDITEVFGADALYEAKSVIAQSESNAQRLFDSTRTLFSTEGASQCIKAMMYLAVTLKREEMSNTVVAFRNAHKAFVQAAALVDFDVRWMWQEDSNSLCSCVITPEKLRKTLSSLSEPPCAVYVTSPDYLGNIADIKGLSEVCHEFGTLLCVDNAHGAYLKFLKESLHPLDLGADLCCDSAHKTLPVLTGGAYLHISKNAPQEFLNQAKNAMALFGSTSPSYLTLCSLDRCNNYLSNGYEKRLDDFINKLSLVKKRLISQNWQVESSDPLRITITAPNGVTGEDIAQRLRDNNIECEYADQRYLVLMLTEQNTDKELDDLIKALGENTNSHTDIPSPVVFKGDRVMSVREAMLSPQETVSIKGALGRVCSSPTVSCPPAVAIAVAGERIDENALRLFEYYKIDEVSVVKDR